MPRRKSASLTTSPEFERVYREGAIFRGRLLSVHGLPNAIGQPRLGLSVSKKVGTAVIRNRVRRRLKEIFWSSVVADIPADLDFVVSARPAAADASFEELNEEFSRSLNKLNKDLGLKGLGEGS